MTKFGAAIVGVGSVSSALYTVIRQFKELGDLADISDMLNIDTKALIGFRLGAEEAGVSAEELQLAIGKLLKTVGNAAQGGKSILGLDARTLAGLPTAEMLLRVADAISRIGTAAARADAISDIFGKGGVRLSAFLGGGRSELEKYVKTIEDLGAAFDRFQVGKIDKANESVGRLGKAFNGLVGTIAEVVSPAIDTMAGMAIQRLSRLKKAVEWFRGSGIANPTDADRVGRPELLGNPNWFWSQTNADKHRQKLMGPPAPMSGGIESAFDREVREDIERKQKRLWGVGDEEGGGIGSGMRSRLGGGLRLLKELGIVSATTPISSFANGGLPSKMLKADMRSSGFRDNPMLDRLGRDLHDVVNDELQFRKEHGGMGRVPGLPFGETIRGFRNPDFPAGANPDVVQRAGILSEMRLISQEGNLSKAQLDAQRQMVAILKRMERDPGGLGK
jgi:hypothetical protein